MTKITTASCLAPLPSLETAWQDVDSSFERFCLTAGIGAIEQMLREDAEQLVGARHSPRRRSVWSPLGPDPGQNRLPWRQGGHIEPTLAEKALTPRADTWPLARKCSHVLCLREAGN